MIHDMLKRAFVGHSSPLGEATGDKIAGGDNLTPGSRRIMHTQLSSPLTCVRPFMIEAPVHLVTICACCASNHPSSAGDWNKMDITGAGRFVKKKKRSKATNYLQRSLPPNNIYGEGKLGFYGDE